MDEIAQKIHTSSNVIYLGRGTLYHIVLEGTLKLKEISYIHAEGFAAGEMKHGPITLMDDTVLIFVLFPKNSCLKRPFLMHRKHWLEEKIFL